VTEDHLRRLLGQGRDPATGDPLGLPYFHHKTVEERISEQVEHLDSKLAPVERKPTSAYRGHQTLQRAWVGDSRAARRAGQSPATAPMRMAAPMPPPQASAGMTTSSCLALA
jgi:hypothetical protein